MGLMTTQQRDLWARLEAFDIDGDSPSLTFTGRLARENGWTPAFAERVVLEYKRFVFLAATAGHPVTPSEHVDQAWHLHLAYTHSYWNRLCTEVLGRALHHNPTRGGRAEDAKFDDWYGRTLASYEFAFGHPPPADIWPPASQRFGDDLDWVRVNRHRCIILPRSAAILAAAFLLATGAAATTLFGVRLRLQAAQQLPNWPVYVFGALVFILMILLIVSVIRGRRSSGGCRSFWGGCGGDAGCASGGCGGGGCGGGCGG